MGPLGDGASARAEAARSRLDAILSLYRAGMAEALPIFPRTSFAWGTAPPGRERHEAEQAWMPQFGGSGDERAEPAHRMLFPDLLTVDDLEATPFPTLAERLWHPIIEISVERNV